VVEQLVLNFMVTDWFCKLVPCIILTVHCVRVTRC